MATNTDGGTTTSLNNTPQAKDDSYTANEDQVLYFCVMENDLGGTAKVLWSIDNTSDDGSTDLVAKDVAGVSEYSELGAKISLTSDGRIKYDTMLLDGLAAGQSVTDQFTYAIRLSNGTLSWATVTVTLTGTNDGPVAHVDTGAAGENESTAFSVLDNDTDVDGGALLTLASIDGVTVDGVAANAGEDAAFAIVGNDIQFTPGTAFDHLAQGDSATVVVTYTLTDEHGATSTSTLTITVTGTNDGPVANADSDSGHENEVLLIDVLANDTDVDDGAVLTVTAASSPAGQGTASVVSNQVQFDPGSDFDHLAVGATANVTVSYTIVDEHGASSSSTVEITVTGTNDGPVANADSDSGHENEVLLIDVLANDTDVDDGAVLTVTAASTPAGQGSASVVGNQVQFDPGSDFDHLAVGATANVTVSYTIVDEHGASSSSTLTITVTGTNDAPVAVADTASTDEDSSVLIDVLGNDDDPDASDTLSISAASVTTGLGSVTIESGQLRYDPGSDYNYLAVGESAEVTLSYTIDDGNGGTDTASVTVTVTGTNDAPELTAAQTLLADGSEDTPYVVSAADLLTGFSDPDSSDVLAVSGLTADHGAVTDNGDGTYTIVPEANYNGPVVLSYSVIDGNGGSVPATLTFNLAPVNDPAVVSGTTTGTVVESTSSDPGTPTATGTLLAADVDNPPNTFVAQASTVTASGYGSFTMTAGGVWTYTLNNGNATVNALTTGMFLIDSFDVQSADGTIQTISVTIEGRTDAVVVTPPPTFNGTGDPNDNDAAGPAAGATVTTTTSGGTETWNGTNGVDTINAGNGTDNVYGHDGNDIINGQNGTDISLYGQVGNDTLTGGSGSDQIFGGSGDDTIYGNEPPPTNETGDTGDNLYGGSGNDIIYGQGGNDLIVGGYGADTLTGGGGDDTFAYLSTLDTNDTILDFMTGNDQIDLSTIDANSLLGGDQAFGWGGETPTANSLWMVESGGNTTIFGDTDGNVATAEFMLTLQGFTGFDPLSPPPVDITF